MKKTGFDPLKAMRGQAAPPPPPPLEQAAFDAAHHAVLEAIPKGVAAVLDAVRKAWDRADRIWDTIRATPAFALGQKPAACRMGCGWCCHQRVGAALPEILAMAQSLKDRPEARQALDTWRPGQPCAFLHNGACRVYDIRPLKCRSLWHVDERHCMGHYAQLPPLGPAPDPAFQLDPKMIYEGALKGLALTLIREGRDCPGAELMPALQALAQRDDAALDWWNGQDILPGPSRLGWFPRPVPAKKKKRG